jgi:phosphatidylserine decarboxylase
MKFLMEIIKEAVKFLNKTKNTTHKEGFWHIITCFGLTLFGFWLPGGIGTFVGTVFLLVSLWCVSFFRDPERIVPSKEGAVISPADGLVSDITYVKPPKEVLETEEEMVRVSIFLSVFNVHVNRYPVSGNVVKTVYFQGKFFNASLDKASEFNERNSILLTNQADGKNIVLVQIAGLLARRIISYAKQSDSAKKGDRYGIIKFGSRVDIYLPKTYKIEVEVGQTMVGGETILAVIQEEKI